MLSLNWDALNNPQLDIVGIVAVLGEGSTTRNAQASALGWHHILPRLLPAPQALLRHAQQKRLPTVPGTVVGAYSGNVKFELNFFCQLLHEDNLAKNEVELVLVTHDDDKLKRKTVAMATRDWLWEPKQAKVINDKQKLVPYFEPDEQAYTVKSMGALALLSTLGFFASVGMFVGSVWTEDGMAFMATTLLSVTSSIVGAASWWKLDFMEDPPKVQPQKDRQSAIPDSDVVIFYPRQGAFRIIRCDEAISRLYFRTEACVYTFTDNVYRLLALVASLLLMAGLLCMSNAKTPMQIAFAACYISLNALYWVISALNPTGTWGHWQHRYKCARIPVLLPAVPGLNTQESFRNTPVTSDHTISRTGIDAHTILSDGRPLGPMPTIEETVANNSPQQIPTDMSQRNNTLQEHFPPSSRRTQRLNVNTEPGLRNDGTQVTVTTNVVNSLDQNPVSPDVEGLRHRHLNPWGSAKDGVAKWFSWHQPTPVNPRKSTTDAAHKSETFTTALWKAIAITGSTRWLRQTHIAPDNVVWDTWIAEASSQATSPRENGGRTAAYTFDDQQRIVLSSWDYQGHLSHLFAKEADLHKRRPSQPKMYNVVTEAWTKSAKVQGISPSVEFMLRKRANNVRQRAE